MTWTFEQIAAIAEIEAFEIKTHGEGLLGREEFWPLVKGIMAEAVVLGAIDAEDVPEDNSESHAKHIGFDWVAVWDLDGWDLGGVTESSGGSFANLGPWRFHHCPPEVTYLFTITVEVEKTEEAMPEILPTQP
ncbi:MAG: hypothetical protein ABIK08_04505 [Pseudomonadota bacterium]